MGLDVDFVRAQFPALQTPWALFDNAGGSVPARPVIDRTTQYMQRHAVQIGASHELSRVAEATVRAGEATAASLLGVTPSETIVSHSTTLGFRLLADGLGPLLQEGDEVVVTNLDHAANIGCWQRMAARHRLTVRTWTLRPGTAQLDVDDLDAILGPRTALVAFTHCANVVGNLVDVPHIVDVIRNNRRDTLVVTDGVAYAPHRQVDIHALGVDVYATSLYKVYGPHLSAIYGRADLLRAAQGQNHAFIDEHRIPYKFQPGNVTHELTAGLVGIGEYLDAVAGHHGVHNSDARIRHANVFALFAAHEAELAARMLEGLARYDAISVVGSTDPSEHARVPTLAFTVAGHRPSDLVPRFDEERIALRHGHFYAPSAIDAFGLAEAGGVIRASLVHYNTLEEVDRFLSVLDRVL